MKKRGNWFWTGCAVALVAAGCGGEKRPAAAPALAPDVASSTTVRSVVVPGRVAVSPSVSVDSELLATCKLPLSNVSEAPKFAFDESDLALADYEMLQLIGRCVSNGPLAGRALKLTGRADSRGTDEYNLALGARRANTVASYLEQFGVEGRQLKETSRGELDSIGTDPAGRQADRRVDISLMK